MPLNTAASSVPFPRNKSQDRSKTSTHTTKNSRAPARSYRNHFLQLAATMACSLQVCMHVQTSCTGRLLSYTGTVRTKDENIHTPCSSPLLPLVLHTAVYRVQLEHEVHAYCTSLSLITSFVACMSIDRPLQGGDVVVFEVDAIGWAPSGARTALSLHHELDPARLPAASAAVRPHGHTPSGRYVLAGGRADEEDGLCQAITPGALKPRVTYRVAGWISVAAAGAGVGGTTTAHHHPAVHVSIRVDGGRCVMDGGAVACSAAASDDASSSRWAEIKGGFRLKESPRSAAVHVHGAPAGVDVKVMDLRIIATDRKARFRYLKDKTDKVSEPRFLFSFIYVWK